MDISVGTPVYGRKGQKIGEVSYFILDGQTDEMTHVVVGKGWLLPRDIVVALADVVAIREGEVQLRLDEQELEQQPDFIETHYVTPEENDPAAASYAYGSYLYTPMMPRAGMGWVMPYGYMPPPPPVETEVNVPEGSVTLAEGTDVWAGETKVGTVDGVRMHPRTGHVSHIVVRKGWLFPDDRLVPTRWVTNVDAEGVHLALSKDELDSRQVEGSGQA